MTEHQIGAISSPSCANFDLQKTADDNEREFGKQTADVLSTNLLKSVRDVAGEVDTI